MGVASIAFLLLGGIASGQKFVALGTTYQFTDSFEGTPPQGWDTDAWTLVDNTAVVPLEVNTLGGAPTGGGSQALMQHWATGEDGQLDWPAYYFDAALEDGDILKFEYWLKYDADFDPSNGSGGDQFVKSIIGRAGSSQELYIDSHMGYEGAPMGVLFQQVTPSADWKYANVNGGTYNMPHGEWVHFRWEIKVATESTAGPENGYLYGWVNGTKRWEHENIYTIYSGQYSEINLNPTFNNPHNVGDSQRRWYDLFKINVDHN